MLVKVTAGIAALYSIGQLRADNPNVSFPSAIPEATLTTYDVYPYVIASQPVYDEALENLNAGDVLDVGGVWTQSWVVSAKTAQEQADYAKNADRVADIAALKVDSEVLALLKARPAQINTYIDNNVNNLTEAKEVLKIYGRALAVLAHAIIN